MIEVENEHMGEGTKHEVLFIMSMLTRTATSEDALNHPVIGHPVLA